jgi:DNA mismatch repair protein MutL
MSAIRRLPADLARKIAAGEVIERPSSVVKELVENALDAGAAEIRVELAEGGKALVRVQDDGRGMDRQDAVLAFERHATSKLAGEEDLDRIATLGFRGEALASIAAVARVVLTTSEGGERPGTTVEVEAGEVKRVADAAFPRGTRVEVRDLFFNLPARRKFLRSSASELTAAAKVLTLIALGHPAVRFHVVHGTRDLLSAPAVPGLRERVFQVFGKDAVDRLSDVAYAEGGCRIDGLASKPPSGRPDRTRQHFFVNGRPVHDRLLQAALQQAYRGLLERDARPEAYLFLTVPFEDVDVNVHPAKSEVRFRDSQRVFGLVARGLEAALRGGPRVKEIAPLAAGEAERPGAWDAGTAVRDFRVEEGRSAPLFAPGEAGAVPPPAAPRVLGQYLSSYIVAAAEEGVYIIDQHNAHERILYDRFAEARARDRIPRKAALLPLLVDLTPAQSVRIEAGRDVLDGAGFRFDAMGGRTVALKEYPDLFGPDAARDAFLAVLDEMDREDKGGRFDRVLATLACKSAVKAGEPLPREKMEFLVAELFKLEDRALCPHGRPIVILVERGQVEKGLKRQPV